MERLPEDESRTGNVPERRDERTIPVMTEDVIVERKVVERGGAIIEKKVLNEEVSFDIDLLNEEIKLERVQVNKYLDETPEPRHEGDTYIIPVIKEVMVKRLLLVEEIRITKEVHTVNRTERVNIRKEEVTVRQKEQGS